MKIDQINDVEITMTFSILEVLLIGSITLINHKSYQSQDNNDKLRVILHSD